MGNEFGLKLKKLYSETYDFLSEKWVITHDEQQASRLQRFAHFWLLVFKSFARNKGPLRATALAYTTLLGLVPLLAVGFGVASSFLKEKGNSETEKILYQFVDTAVPQLQILIPDTNKVSTLKGASKASKTTTGKANTSSSTPIADGARDKVSNQKIGSVASQPTRTSIADTNTPTSAASEDQVLTDPRKQVVSYLNQFIQNAQSKTLGISGIIGFIVVAVMLLSTIEDTFNDIWGVTRGRSWFRRFVQYWTTISLGPLVMALIITLMGSSFFQQHQPTIPFSAVYGKLVLSFFLVSGAFALFYKLMPNTQVHWRAATIAGAVGGALWLFMNRFSVLQGSKIIQMSKIYGTLSLIPIFLLGLYFSWLILLFGAQVAYALQNRRMYLQERKAESVNQRGREYVALRVMTYLAQRFDHGPRPPTILELGTMIGVPSRLIGRVLQPLIQAGLVLEVSGGSEAAYAPARPLENITCHDILQTMRVVGGQELATRDEPTRVLVCAEFERIYEAEKEAANATTLRDLVNRIPFVEAHHDPDKVEQIYNQATIAS